MSIFYNSLNKRASKNYNMNLEEYHMNYKNLTTKN